jgi:cysteinyl-tRNA synthetase
MEKINDLLGVVHYAAGNSTLPSVPEVRVDESRILALIEERTAAKRHKDFARADAIRSELLEEGIELRDSPTGTEWIVKSTL